MNAALTLLIIRHAEKPQDGQGQPPGLTEAGVEDDKSLVIPGWQRAGAWTALFGAGLGGTDYPAPDAIFAATPGDGDDHGPSKRPCETATPLAARLPQIRFDTSFGLGQEAALIARIQTLSGVALVAWEHKAIIAALIPAIPLVSGSPPSHWPGDRFDVVLRFDRAVRQTGFAFRELYPCLLAGDSRTPLG